MSIVRCPKCGGYAEVTVLGSGERLLGGAATLVGGLFVGMFNQHAGMHLAKQAGNATKNTPCQYKCQSCGHTFHK